MPSALPPTVVAVHIKN